MSFAVFNPYKYVFHPIVTEKSDSMLSIAKYCFVVSKRANKSNIKRSVEMIFDVVVKSVNILNIDNRERRFRGIRSKKMDTKKAIVTLSKGEIDLFVVG